MGLESQPAPVYGVVGKLTNFNYAVFWRAVKGRVRILKAQAAEGAAIAEGCFTQGIDLQKQCNTVVHYDLEWNPARVEQREGRVDRLGRDSDEPVEIITFKLADTYDERILARCENRKIWMELYLCKTWQEESHNADKKSADRSIRSPDLPEWLVDYQLDLRSLPVQVYDKSFE